MRPRIHASLTRAGAALVLAGCSDGKSPAAPAPLPEIVDQVAAAQLRAADSTFVVAFPAEAPLLARAGVPNAESPLIGRNREWGEMYAARFQMGTGSALRISLLLNRPDEVRRALAGLVAGLSTMEASGRLPARVPLSVSFGASPSEADVASGAAFYLGDACLGMLALEAAADRDRITSAANRARIRGRLARALDWLHGRKRLLLEADRAAPNRLLFDARALYGCEALTGRASEASAFIAAFDASLAPGGWFVEGDGWDSSYQAVALEIGADVLAVLPDGASRAALDSTLRVGTAWLTARVGSDGRVDSGGNTRTCGGGESFLGVPKRLAVSSVVAGLGRMSSRRRDAVVAAADSAARRVALWALNNPDADPCFASGA